MSSRRLSAWPACRPSPQEVRRTHRRLTGDSSPHRARRVQRRGGRHDRVHAVPGCPVIGDHRGHRVGRHHGIGRQELGRPGEPTQDPGRLRSRQVLHQPQERRAAADGRASRLLLAGSFDLADERPALVAEECQQRPRSPPRGGAACGRAPPDRTTAAGALARPGVPGPRNGTRPVRPYTRSVRLRRGEAVAVGLTAVAVLALAACGSGSPSASSSTTTSGRLSTTTTAVRPTTTTATAPRPRPPPSWPCRRRTAASSCRLRATSAARSTTSGPV